VTVDWSKRGDYIAKHGVTAAQASEALTDPDAVVFNPTTTRATAKVFAPLAFRLQRLRF
jgi:uncharacterized DUF497 family protein